jgi:hypothetical protein
VVAVIFIDDPIRDYHEEVRRDIAKEFGLEAGGYAPRPKQVPISICLRLLDKYPALDWKTPHPKVIQISRRYMSLFGRYL